MKKEIKDKILIDPKLLVRMNYNKFLQKNQNTIVIKRNRQRNFYTLEQKRKALSLFLNGLNGKTISKIEIANIVGMKKNSVYQLINQFREDLSQKNSLNKNIENIPALC